MERGPRVERTPGPSPHRGAARARAVVVSAVRRRRRARAATQPTAAQSRRGGAAGAGAERHADPGDAGLASGATDVGTRGDEVGGNRCPPRSPRWSAVHARGLHGGGREKAIAQRSHGGRPVVWVRKRWKRDKEDVLVWGARGVGVGGLVSERRCPLVIALPQKCW